MVVALALPHVAWMWKQRAGELEGNVGGVFSGVSVREVTVLESVLLSSSVLHLYGANLRHEIRFVKSTFRSSGGRVRYSEGVTM